MKITNTHHPEHVKETFSHVTEKVALTMEDGSRWEIMDGLEGGILLRCLGTKLHDDHDHISILPRYESLIHLKAGPE